MTDTALTASTPLKMQTPVSRPAVMLGEILPSSTSLLTFLREPLKDDDIAEFNDLCAKCGVAVEFAPIYADLINLRAVRRSQIDCEGCTRTSNRACYKYIAEVYENRVKCRRQVCNDVVATQIINRSGIPDIFKKCRTRDWKVNPSNNATTIAAIAAIRDNKGLFVSGRAGTGKTLLSSIIVNERAYMGKASWFFTVTSLLEDLRDFSDKLSRDTKFQKVCSCKCLVIDDLGAEYVSDWVSSTLFMILDERYKRNLQTIINSNFDLNVLAARYSDYHGERIVRRIQALCTIANIA